MKISLEFDDMEKFFNELPRFAALIGFSGQFATFTHAKKPDTVPSLEEPELPAVTQDTGGITITATESRTPEENARKINAAAKVLNATKDSLHIPRTDAGSRPGADAAGKAADAAGKGTESTGAGDDAPAEEKPAKTADSGAKKAARDTDVRKALNAIIQTGRREKVAELLGEFGAKNFTGLKEKDYAAVVERAGEVLAEIKGGGDSE